MKVFLGIDLTKKKNENKDELLEDVFLIEEPSSTMIEAFDDSLEKSIEEVKRAKLPIAFRIAEWVSGVVGLILVSGFFSALTGDEGVAFDKAYANSGWLLWVGIILLVASAAIFLFGKVKEKKVLDSEESKQTMSRLDSVSDNIFSELGVPADAKDVDVLSFFYKVKDGEIKACENISSSAPFSSSVFKIYADLENLYLVNLDGKYAFARSMLTSIRKINKRTIISGWNKDENFNKGIFKQYNIKGDQMERIHCKCRYVLELNREGELWNIYFPNYELPVFEEMTGLKAEEEQEN